jgi:hypothetical protein
MEHAGRLGRIRNKRFIHSGELAKCVPGAHGQIENSFKNLKEISGIFKKTLSNLGSINGNFLI